MISNQLLVLLSQRLHDDDPPRRLLHQHHLCNDNVAGEARRTCLLLSCHCRHCPRCSRRHSPRTRSLSFHQMINPRTTGVALRQSILFLPWRLSNRHLSSTNKPDSEYRLSVETAHSIVTTSKVGRYPHSLSCRYHTISTHLLSFSLLYDKYRQSFWTHPVVLLSTHIYFMDSCLLLSLTSCRCRCSPFLESL